MRTFLNRTALKISAGYFALVVLALMISARSSDLEGRALGDFVLGFPWVLAIQSDSPWGTALFVALNVVSLYVVTLIFIEMQAD
jgi:hypothetical protein